MEKLKKRVFLFFSFTIYAKMFMGSERMEKYIPDIYKKNIFEIDYKKLKERGIKCLLFDLDNTIMPYKEKKVSAEVQELIYNLKKMKFKIIIFSNSPKLRVKAFGDALNVDVVAYARKPHKKSFFKVLKKYKFAENEVAIIGDQMLTDIVGGNKIGITTILTTPVGKDPIWTKINRMRENNIMLKLRDNSLFTKGKYYDEV